MGLSLADFVNQGTPDKEATQLIAKNAPLVNTQQTKAPSCAVSVSLAVMLGQGSLHVTCALQAFLVRHSGVQHVQNAHLVGSPTGMGLTIVAPCAHLENMKVALVPAAAVSAIEASINIRKGTLHAEDAHLGRGTLAIAQAAGVVRQVSCPQLTDLDASTANLVASGHQWYAHHARRGTMALMLAPTAMFHAQNAKEAKYNLHRHKLDVWAASRVHSSMTHNLLPASHFSVTFALLVKLQVRTPLPARSVQQENMRSIPAAVHVNRVLEDMHKTEATELCASCANRADIRTLQGKQIALNAP
jgi:hypothetical protein